MLSWLVLIATLGRAPEPRVVPLQLTPEMRSWVTRRLPGNRTARWRWQRLAIELRRDGGFRQVPLLTSTAPEAFATRRGNCVSFAHLVVALAREANLDAYFVLVDDPVQTLRRGTLRVEQNHLAAALSIGRIATVLDLDGLRRLGPRARRVSDRTATAVMSRR